MPTDWQNVVSMIDPAAKFVRARALTGGVSARVTALELERPDGQREQVVVRQHGAEDLRRDPHIAAHEYALLRQLESAGIPAPSPRYVDESGDILPTPYVVTGYVDGDPDPAPLQPEAVATRIAALLADIHRAGVRASYVPEADEQVAATLSAPPAVLDETLSESVIREALESVWSHRARNVRVLLHGDFWPGNLLWKDGRITAVLDWEDAAIGDPLLDVGNTRLELLWAYGAGAMGIFTEHYRSITGVNNVDLPVWDLWAALRPASRLSTWGLEPADEARMREAHHWFVRQALAALP